LRVTFVLSNGTVFAGTNNNILVLTGLRMSAKIICSGFPSWPEMDLAVWGMRISDMNALSSLSLEVEGVNRNTVLLEANSGDGSGWRAVYSGQIVTAGIDYSARPDVPLRIAAQVLYYDMVNPAKPTSYTGSVSAATVISNLAASIGCGFENNGVTTILPGSPYYPGTVVDQIRECALDAGIDVYAEPSSTSGGVPGLDSSGTAVSTQTVIAICPKGAPRNLPSTFTLSPSTGLDGYPSSDSRGNLNVISLFNPAFRFGGPLIIAGSNVIIEGTGKNIGTLNSRANGNWMIGTLRHQLDAEVYNGKWHSYMLLYPPDQSPPQQ